MLNNQPAGDLWHLQDNDAESQWFGKTFHFDFSYIHSEDMKLVVKDYVWQNWKTGNKTVYKLYNDLDRFKHFAEFAKHHAIYSFHELDNIKVDLFLSYLRRMQQTQIHKELMQEQEK